MHGETVKFN